MNRILLSFLCLFFTGILSGQKNSDRILVYMRDGAAYVGDLLGKDDSGMTILKTIEGDTAYFFRASAKRYYDADNAIIFDNRKFFKTSGTFMHTALSFNTIGVFDKDDRRFSGHLEFIFGKRLKPYFNIGGGMGVEANEARVAGFTFNAQFLSFFGYGRLYLTRSKPRLFVFGRLGYGLPSVELEEGMERQHFGGINTQYGGGFHFASRKRRKFLLSFGHYMQKTKGEESFFDHLGNEVHTKYDILINRLLIKLGVEFK